MASLGPMNACKKTFILKVLILLLSLSYGPLVRADWINLTGAQSAPNIAEIYVEDDRIRLVLEIYVKDLDKFVDLLPEEWIRKTGVDPPPIQERVKRFAAETFQFIVDGKEKLQAELVQVEPRLRKDRPNPFAGTINPYTRQQVPGGPERQKGALCRIDLPF